MGKEKLSKDSMIQIFNELTLYYTNHPYKDYSKENIKLVLKTYYNSLKYYTENQIRKKMTRHIETNRYFPQVSDLIPEKNDMLENVYDDGEDL